MANSLQWNFVVEHAFSRSTTLEVGYVGDHALHQLNTYDINYVPQSQVLEAAFQPGGNVNSLRRFPGWSSMTWWLNNGDATYNSLQVLFKVQRQKFQLQAAYTWSHSIGNGHSGQRSIRLSHWPETGFGEVSAFSSHASICGDIFISWGPRFENN